MRERLHRVLKQEVNFKRRFLRKLKEKGISREDLRTALRERPRTLMAITILIACMVALGTAMVVEQFEDEDVDMPEGERGLELNILGVSNVTHTVHPNSTQLNPIVNPIVDHSPSIIEHGTSPNECMVAFCSNRGGKSDIWITELTQNGTWSAPRALNLSSGGDWELIDLVLLSNQNDRYVIIFECYEKPSNGGSDGNKTNASSSSNKILVMNITSENGLNWTSPMPLLDSGPLLKSTQLKYIQHSDLSFMLYTNDTGVHVSTNSKDWDSLYDSAPSTNASWIQIGTRKFITVHEARNNSSTNIVSETFEFIVPPSKQSPRLKWERGLPFVILVILVIIAIVKNIYEE